MRRTPSEARKHKKLFNVQIEIVMKEIERIGSQAQKSDNSAAESLSIYKK